MNLSRGCTYALHALLQLARAGPQGLACNELAAAGEMPQRYLLQIMRKLVVSGIAESGRGARGGYRLCRSPQEISLLEIIDAVSGPSATETSTDLGTLPEPTQARLSNALGSIARQARDQLAALKLAQFLPPSDNEKSRTTAGTTGKR